MPRPKTAEDAFREAFQRLVSGTPVKLPLGSKVSQNNVAKEAGRSPSALRKERFPELIDEIKFYLANNSAGIESTSELRAKSAVDTSLRARYEELRTRQNYETSRLLSALAELAELKRYVVELEHKLSNQALLKYESGRN